MQEENRGPAREENGGRAMSVDEGAPTGQQFPSPRPDSTAKPRRHSAASTQSGPTAARAYEFVINEGGEMAESRRKQLRQHVMHDYMHRRRTLAAMGPAQDTGRLLGWRNVDPPDQDDASVQIREIGQESIPGTRSQTPTLQESSTTSIKREKLPLRKFIPPVRVRAKSKVRQVDERKKLARHGGSSPSDSSSPSTPQSADWWEDLKAWESVKRVAGTEYLVPQSHLGAGLLDPFNSFPVAVTPSDQALINHYLNTLPYIRYQMLSVVDYNPHKLLFHQVLMHDAAAFQAVLALASKHTVTGLSGQKDTIQSLAHKTRTIELVNQRLQDPVTAVQDSTLYAIGALSVIEKWADNYEAERAHYRGLTMLLKERGGMKEIRKSNRFLEAAIYWVELSRAPGPNTIGSLPFSGATPDDVPSSFNFLTAHLEFPLAYSPPPNTPMRETPEEIYDLLLACEQFLAFFRCLLFLHRQRSESRSCLHPRRYHALRSSLFNPGSTLTKVLAESPWPHSRTVSGVRYHKDLCWIGSLLFINFTLWDFSNQLKRLEGYLSWLENEVRLKGLDTNHSVETLLWIFWRDRATGGDNYVGKTTDSPEMQEANTGSSRVDRRGVIVANTVEERNWFVTRLLRVAKRLSNESWAKVRDTLLAFILAPEEYETAVDDSSTRSKSMKVLPWSDDEMRREILGNLYLCPPVSKQTGG